MRRFLLVFGSAVGPMMGPMRRTLAFILSLYLVALAGAVHAESIDVVARAVPLFVENPERTEIGRLRYRGGLEMASPDPRFGGLSGLVVSPDGSWFTAVSDRGTLFRGRLDHSPAGRLVGIGDVGARPLGNLNGRPLTKKAIADAESLALTGDGGLYVAFERRHRIWRYGADGHPLVVPTPKELRRARRNGGIEALARLGDGRLLALTEGPVAGTTTNGWVGGGSNGWTPVVIARRDDFKPTGAAVLPDGAILVLERRYSPVLGPAARVMRIPIAALDGPSPIWGEPLGELLFPATVDNFEGIAVRQGSNGETLIYLLSDDNFNILQRTLLLMFELTSQ